MGAMQNQGRSGKNNGKSTRGSVKNAARLDAFQGRSGSGSGDWGACDPARLQAVVVLITGLGGAVTLGLSKNQGAHSLTLLLDGERQTLWFNGDADLNACLDEVTATLDAMDA